MSKSIDALFNIELDDDTPPSPSPKLLKKKKKKRQKKKKKGNSQDCRRPRRFLASVGLSRG
jgi:hypothetical protein